MQWRAKSGPKVVGKQGVRGKGPVGPRGNQKLGYGMRKLV